MLRIRHQSLVLAVVAFVCGCTPPPQGDIESNYVEENTKIRAEAFSFNARLHRDGKPTSFKLEIYYTDSLLGLYGRGYLGKTALKGRLTTDSLEVYFPTSKEYVYEALTDMLSSSQCPFPMSELEVLSLFGTLPDMLAIGNDIRVVSDYRKSKRPKFEVFAESCPWRLNLTYDKRKTGWRIREFEFTDGERLRLKAKREKYKATANIKVNRFRVSVPGDAIKISP